jgi:ATP adenylyltransferase/5',5'''-P-1,P-4-tetraphosphate phosphorylase II
VPVTFERAYLHIPQYSIGTVALHLEKQATRKEQKSLASQEAHLVIFGTTHIHPKSGTSQSKTHLQMVHFSPAPPSLARLPRAKNHD